MKITKLHIIGFGKLKNLDVDLSKGLNVVYGKNEQGKSTLMAFIKAMFYGFPSSGKSILGNERKKFSPWDGTQMGGAIYFDFNGSSYSLQKTFGIRKSLDKVNLWNLNKGEQVELPNKIEVGEYLFGISLNTFENTTYIGQLGNIISASKDKNGEIISKLTNLVSTGEEDVSFKETDKRIKDAMTDLVATRGSGGKLNNEKSKLIELQELRNTAIDNDMKKSELKRNIESLKNKIHELNAKIKFQSDLYKQQCDLRKLDELNIIMEKKSLVNEEENHIKIINEKLNRDGFIIDEEYLKSIKNKLQLFSKEKEVYESKKEDYENAASKLAELERSLNEFSIIKEVNIDDIRHLESIIGNLTKLNQSIESVQTSLSQAEASKANLNSDITKSESVIKSSIALSKDEINRSLSEIDSINTSIEKANKAVEEAHAKVNDFNLKSSDSKLIELNNKLKSCEKDINIKELAVNELSKKHSNALQKMFEARSNVKSAEAVAKVKLDAVNSEVEKEISNLCSRKSKSSKGTTLTAAIGIIAVSILLGIFVNPVFFIGISISVILFIISGKNNKSSYKLNNMKDELKNNAEKEKKDILQQIQCAKAAEEICNKEESDLLNQLNMAKQELQFAKTNYENIKNEINKESNEIERIKLNFEIAKANLQREISFLNERKDISKEKKTQLEDAKKKLINQENQLMEISLQWKESINNADNFIAVRKEELASAQGKLKDYIESLKVFNDCQNFSQIINSIRQQINEALTKCGCDSIDELQEKHTKLRSLSELINDKNKELKLKKMSLCSNNESVIKLSNSLFSLIEKYKTAQSMEDINNFIIEVEDSLSEQRDAYSKREVADKVLENTLKGQSTYDIEMEIKNLSEKLVENNFNILPSKLSEEEFNNIKNIVSSLQEEINDVKEEISSKEAELNLTFKDVKSLSVVEGSISSTKENINDMEYYYQCLDIARTVFNESFEEMQKNFGPALNKETSSILNKITEGRYKELLIAKTFDISITDPSSAAMHLWEYLSGGTVDQVYFSLRLAIAGLLTENKESLPVLLDDAFIQYDDGRAYQAINFLNSAANTDLNKDNSLQQVILFTCHSKISEFAESFNDTNMILL
ncbi:MAG: hypothetical protein K0R54_508 [Clostridiaceae bacterium]|nr:hypothetical protein [Clostridiaceae bacterium]